MDNFPGDLSYSLRLLVGFGLVEVDHDGRLSTIGRVGSLVAVEGDPLADAGLGLRTGLPGVEIVALIFQGRPEALDEDIVEAAPFASIEMRVPTRFSRSVRAKDVNWLLRSVFMISG